MHAENTSQAPGLPGLVLHSAARYDLAVKLITFGRERALREKLLGLARCEAGESVLDVGCGTGTLAIAAKRRVGPTGVVVGVDASPEMIARASMKSQRAGVDAAFQVAFAQALPFPDAQFDVAMTTMVLHHLPRGSREECVKEMRRVVKPGGRLLVVDFAASPRKMKGFLRRFRRHGHVRLEDVLTALNGAGLQVAESGAVGFRSLQFALATVPENA